MNEENKDTKDKILEAAEQLFAEKGFNGASVREIASQAQVNLAAVNYHFINKQNLYCEVIKKCYIETSYKIRELYHQSATTTDFATRIFDYFIANSHALRTHFKMILDDNTPFPDYIGTEDDLIGPPGGKVLLESIQNDAQRELSKEKAIWAVRVIFSHVLHMSIISVCTCNQRPGMKEQMSPEVIKKGIRELVNIIIADIRMNS